ncbi:hypothetical protein H6G94_11065 [Nostoc punctiforme FACHB-252]|uniref:Transposase n=1 Tax=Nostoc punctiforme FACHB-252 TaxID=1357509 RepID=A0ABR8H812_NOSPU|nr:hypothetical protein [Nostoc punctiforme]MBD2611809.1 hypothetical protein [Nostoc punctiforme FACHB-252]
MGWNHLNCSTVQQLLSSCLAIALSTMQYIGSYLDDCEEKLLRLNNP